VEKTRFGCIGLKGIGQTHLNAIKNVEDAQLIAVVDIREDVAQRVGEEHQVDFYTDYREMLERDDLDVVCIGTPHYLHHPMTIHALKAGKHVLCEKPLAMTVRQADEMCETARSVGRKLGVFHQRRTSASSGVLKSMLEKETLGKLLRIVWMACSMRTQKYFDSDAWRGTWAQEGGGVLINQTVHDLDMIGYLFGDVVEVIGKIETRSHNIQVEDLATAIFGFANGARGVFQAGLVESPGSSHMEIAGEKGTLISDRSGMRLGRPNQNVTDFIRGTSEAWGRLEVTWEDVVVEKRESGHKVLVQDMIDAIHQNRAPMIPGEQGTKAVELVNAIILSSERGRPVSLPLNREQYERCWRKLAKNAKG
jgi:predicted dehydrogenase